MGFSPRTSKWPGFYSAKIMIFSSFHSSVLFFFAHWGCAHHDSAFVLQRTA